MAHSEHAIERWAPATVADGTTLIDLGFQDVQGVIGAYLLAGSGELALIESGPSSTRGHLARGIAEAGYDLGDVSRLIVTHIHLDHAGAAGTLLRDYPQMRLTVHPNGAPHMIDPGRLVKSATRIYGDQMERLWGEVVGVDPERVDVIQDGDVIEVAGTSLLVKDAPGHAGTQVVLLDGQTGVLFSADAAGARLQGSAYVCPTISPPELDFPVWEQTVKMMRALKPKTLALTHFGVFHDADRHLAQLIPNIEAEVAVAREVLRTEADVDALTERLLAREREIYAAEGADVEERMRQMEYAMPAWLGSLGLLRVFKKAGLLDQ